MSFDYARAAEKGRAIIAKFGQLVTVRRISAANNDPTDPETGPLYYDREADVMAAVLPVAASTVGMGVGDTVIRSTDGMIYAGADIAFPPEENDVVQTANGDFRIIGVTTIAPAGIAVLYQITVRK